MGAVEQAIDEEDDPKTAIIELIVKAVASRGGLPEGVPTRAAAPEPEPESESEPDSGALVPTGSNPYVKTPHGEGKAKGDQVAVIATVPMEQRPYDFFINHCQKSGVRPHAICRCVRFLGRC